MPHDLTESGAFSCLSLTEIRCALLRLPNPQSKPLNSNVWETGLSQLTGISPDVRASKGGSSDTDVEGPSKRQLGAGQIRVVSGSPSFVAVVQSTDLGHRHD